MIRIHNNSYTESRGTSISKTDISDREMLIDKINETFGFPRNITKEVLDTIPVFVDIY